MAFDSNVNIFQLGGGTGRPQIGFDFYSGLMFYGTAPTVTGKWATFNGTPNIKHQQLFSPADATSAGILPNTENVASTSTHVIVRGSTGDTLQIKCALPTPNTTTSVTDFGVYTQLAGDSTSTILAASYAAVINAGTVTHGFTAVAVTGTITITAPKSAGVSLNTGTPYSATVTGTITDTITQNVVAGTASQYAIWFYHISEYFRKNPTGNLRVGIIAASSSFNEVATLSKSSSSKIRWIGVYDTTGSRGSAANITGTITLLDTAAKTLQKTAPVNIFYSPNIAAVADLSTYPDQNLNTANKVTTILSQDGDAAGALLYVQSGQTIGNIGAKLGSQSSIRVSADDSQPIESNNISNGVENNTPAFGNGLLAVNVTQGLQDQLDSYRYVFFRQFGDNIVGTFWTSNKCCINASSDYAFKNDNAVSDKISRICYSTYLPLIKSELIFNGDGTLQDHTIETFRDAGVDAITAAMITGFGQSPLISGVAIKIDSTQPVKSTENLTITVVIVENGIARNITVNIGYGTI